jgi:hypothetical protein
LWEPLDLPVGPPGFEREVYSFDPPEFGESPLERLIYRKDMLAAPVSPTSPTRFTACCATEAIGKAVATPPKSTMNSRRCMFAPKLRRRDYTASIVS